MYVVQNNGHHRYSSILRAIEREDMFQRPYPAYALTAEDLIDDYNDAGQSPSRRPEFAFPMWHFAGVTKSRTPSMARWA
jgi:hypothetical protein